MTRLSCFALLLFCAVCLIVIADEQENAVPARPGASETKKEVPANQDAPEKKQAKPAQLQVQPIQVAVQINGFGTPFGAPENERVNVERTDDVERFVLLTPRGPVVVEAKIALDGQPFRAAREKLVDEMLAAADSNGDGKATWKEAVVNPKFIFGNASFRLAVPVAAPVPDKNQQQPDTKRAADKGDAKNDDKEGDDKEGDDKEDNEKNKQPNKKQNPFQNNPFQNPPPPQVQFQVFQLGNQNPDQQDEMIKHLDTNRNGLVDRSEARLMLARTSGGPTFSLAGAFNRFQQADVKSVLDKNSDGKLSPEELESASESLQSRDANGNDLLEPSELGASGIVRNAGGGQVIMVQAFSSAGNRQTAGYLLGPTADYPALYGALKEKYGGKAGTLKAASFSLISPAFAQLDANNNGELESHEVANLEQVLPHIRLRANIAAGDGKENSGGVLIQSIAKELGNAAAVSDKLKTEVALDLGDVKLRFVTAGSPARQFDYRQTSQRMVDRYDTNGNGYIEAKEMEKVNVGLVQQFKRWDMNSDGKVYAAEITESYRRQQAPMLSRVTAQVGEEGPSLFGVLDQSGDQRLSLREMKTAAKQLKLKDKNGDGQITLDEIPGEIHVSFVQGHANSASFAFTSSVQRRNAKTKSNQEKGPDWFTRMDRNGDGDVTLREFLGSEEQFKQIDGNGDGFIELKEALAADLPGLKRGD